MVDLEEKNKSETTKLFDIQSGIGGYMPRYIADSMGKKVRPSASLANSAQIAQTGKPETCQRLMVSFGSWRVIM